MNISVHKISINEYKSLLKGKSYPLYFDPLWIQITSNNNPILRLIRYNGEAIALFTALYHHKAIITSPFCQYQGWIPLKNNLSIELIFSIINRTIESFPNNYFIELGLYNDFITPQKQNIDHYRQLGFMVEERKNYIYNTLCLRSIKDLSSSVSSYIRREYSKALRYGFYIDYNACAEDAIRYAQYTAFRKKYKSHSDLLKYLTRIYTDNTQSRIIAVRHPKVDHPIMVSLYVEHQEISYSICSGYTDDYTTLGYKFNCNFNAFLLYNYIKDNKDHIKAIDFAGSQMHNIARLYEHFGASLQNYLVVKKGFYYHPMRFIPI